MLLKTELKTVVNETNIFTFEDLDTNVQERLISDLANETEREWNCIDNDWLVDNCGLFYIEGEELKDLPSFDGDTDVLANTRKNIGFDLGYGSYVHCKDAIEVNNEKLFLEWLGLDKVSHCIDYEFENESRYKNTSIDITIDYDGLEFEYDKLLCYGDKVNSFNDLTNITRKFNEPQLLDFINELKENNLTIESFVKLLIEAKEKFDDFIRKVFVGIKDNYEYRISKEYARETLRDSSIYYDENGEETDLTDYEIKVLLIEFINSISIPKKDIKINTSLTVDFEKQTILTDSGCVSFKDAYTYMLYDIAKYAMINF